MHDGAATVLTSDPKPGIRLIELNRPGSLNALNAEMVAELEQALSSANDDRSVRIVVLTGRGRAFCAGLDLKSYGDMPDATGTATIDGLTRQREIAHLVEALHSLTKPVIAAVNGAATGGGLALVLASDIRLGSAASRFAVSFIRAGFSACDIGTSWLLPRIVGAGAAHELMLTGRVIESDEAARIGLIQPVLEEDLMEAAFAKAEQIMLNPPFSVELTKQGMWLALQMPSLKAAIEFENRQQILTSLTQDRAEATAAFFEKRPPNYNYR